MASMHDVQGPNVVVIVPKEDTYDLHEGSMFVYGFATLEEAKAFRSEWLAGKTKLDLTNPREWQAAVRHIRPTQMTSRWRVVY